MASTASTASPGHGPAGTRRDFLFIATATVGAVGAAAALVPLVDQMNPDASTLAAGGPVDLDVSKIEEGAAGHDPLAGAADLRVPSLARRRWIRCRSQQMTRCLSDPNSEQMQQPPYATNWHRSIKPEFGVLVGICTHLGCIPMFYPHAERDHAGDRIGRAAISAPATARNTIRPAASSPACRRPTICRCRPTASSTTRRCGSARTIPARGLEFRFDPAALDPATLNLLPERIGRRA